MRKTIFYITFSFILLFSTKCYAGWAGGPYLIWFNLSTDINDATAVDKRLKKFVNEDVKFCWDDGMLLFMKNRPTVITRKLVADAVISKDPVAQKKIDFILKQPFGEEAASGFDGMVVYVNGSIPRLFAITRGRRKMQSFPVKKPDHLEAAFCNVMPDIVRPP